MRILLASLLLILWPILAWSQPSHEPAPISTPSSPSAELPPAPVTHTFTDAEWTAFEAEVWAEEERAIKEAVEAAVAPHVAYETGLLHSLTTWRLVSAGEGVVIVGLILALVFHK
jgi:hypothetical protein